MKQLLSRIKDNDILLEVVDGKLKIFAKNATPNPELISEIRARKEELLHFLSGRDQAAFTESFQATIPVIPVAEDYALSSSQKMLWIVSQFEQANIGYNIPGVHVFEGNLDYEAFSAALQAIVDRHENLRTVFRENAEGEVRQVVLPSASLPVAVPCNDLRNAADQEQQVKALVSQHALTPFDLVNGPLLHARLIQIEDHKWVFSYVLHHIISDGWSMDILMKELLLFYNAYTTGQTPPVAPLRIQYKDYTAWQQQQLQGESLQAHKDYWLKQFEGELPILALPSDKPRPAVKTYSGADISGRLGAGITKDLKALCQQQGATLFMGLMAAVNALLYRYTGQNDIVIGSPIAGRAHADLEDQIGFYVNTLAFRSRFKGEDSFVALLDHVKQVTLGAYEHQIYPFGELVEALQLQRDMSRNPLFDVQVTLGHSQGQGTGAATQLGDLKVSTYADDQLQTSRFDIVFNFAEQGDELLTGILYNPDVYGPETILRLGQHLEQLLTAIVADPQLPIGAVEYLSAEEREELLVGFQGEALPGGDAMAAGA
ncbi:condensation domain-containing protein, partial [Hymenobacter lucidus]